MNHNFNKDVLEWANRAIVKLKLKLKLKHKEVTDSSPQLALIQFFKIIRNKIPPVPREIIKAKNFSVSAGNVRGYEILVDEIMTGVDLSPRGSRQQRKPIGHLDPMLLDWDIHHLHLGVFKFTEGKHKGLIEGGKEILFAYFTDELAYFIGIYDHDSWSRKEVLEVLNDNWPHLMEAFKIDRTGLERGISDADHAKMRKAKINVAVKIGENHYFGPGGGYAGSGDGEREVDKALLVMRSVGRLTSLISKYYCQLEIIHRENQGCDNNLYLNFDVGEFISSGKVAVILSSSKQEKIFIPEGEIEPLVHASLAGYCL